MGDKEMKMPYLYYFGKCLYHRYLTFSALIYAITWRIHSEKCICRWCKYFRIEHHIAKSEDI